MARSGSRLAFIGHYLLATVKAVGTYVMTSVRFTGCAFNRQRWIAQRVVRASLPSARSCHLTFLYCHFKSSFIYKIVKRSFAGRYYDPFVSGCPRRALHKFVRY